MCDDLIVVVCFLTLHLQPEELDQSHTTVFEVDENAKDELEGEYLVAFNKIHEKFHVMPFTTRFITAHLIFFVCSLVYCLIINF